MIRRAAPRGGGAVLLVAALAAGVHGRAPWNGFAYDDVHVVVENEILREAAGDPARLGELVASPYWEGGLGRDLGLWRPVTTVALAAQWALFDGSPAGFHVVNVLLHVGVSLLVLLLLWRWFGPLAACSGAAVFAVHPVHVEAVANVVGLAELLAAGFVLSACVLYARWRDTGGIGPLRAMVLGVLYAGAFLSKEGAAVLPALLVLLDWTLEPVPLRATGAWLAARAWLLGVLAAVAAGVLALRGAVLSDAASALPPLGAARLEGIEPIWTVLSVWPHYVRLLLYPADLSVDYGPRVVEIQQWWGLPSALGLAAALGALGAAWLAVRRGADGPASPPDAPAPVSPRWLALAVLWFVVAVAPVSNLLFLTGVFLAERTLYLPSVGLAVAVAWGVARIGPVTGRAGAGTAALAAVAVAVVLLGARSWVRTPTWRDSSTVFATLLREHPESGRAQWLHAADRLEAGSVEEGMRAGRAAIAAVGAGTALLVDLGSAAARLQRPDLAETLLRRAREDDPGSAVAASRLAELYVAQGRWPEAEAAASAALALAPEAPLPPQFLAVARARTGDLEGALEARRLAARTVRQGAWIQWYWIAEHLGRLGRPAEAAAARDSATALAPDDRARAMVDALSRGAAHDSASRP